MPSSRASNPLLLCLLHWQAGSLPLVPLRKLEGVVCNNLSPAAAGREGQAADYVLTQWRVSEKQIHSDSINQ